MFQFDGQQTLSWSHADRVYSVSKIRSATRPAADLAARHSGLNFGSSRFIRGGLPSLQVRQIRKRTPSVGRVARLKDRATTKNSLQRFQKSDQVGEFIFCQVERLDEWVEVGIGIAAAIVELHHVLE